MSILSTLWLFVHSEVGWKMADSSSTRNTRLKVMAIAINVCYRALTNLSIAITDKLRVIIGEWGSIYDSRNTLITSFLLVNRRAGSYDDYVTCQNAALRHRYNARIYLYSIRQMRRIFSRSVLTVCSLERFACTARFFGFIALYGNLLLCGFSARVIGHVKRTRYDRRIS